MVEHRTERVLASRSLHGQLYSLGDGRAERTGIEGVAGDDVLAGTGRHRWRALDRGSEGAHQYRAVGLLLHGNLDLVDSSLETKYLGGIGQRGAPLARSGLGGDVGYALSLAIIALCECRIDFV